MKSKQSDQPKCYSKSTALTLLGIVSVVSVILTVLGFLWLKKNFGDQNLLREWAVEHPVLGALLMIVVSALQVVVALLPSELIEVAAGYIFGAWLGAFLCLVGISLGSIAVILLTRRFGRRLVAALYPPEKLESLPILNDPGKRNAATAILFLIPGTPKDLITYLLGLTSMTVPQYLVLTALCRFPSIIMTTLGGDALGDDRLVKALWIFVITGIVSAGGYLIYRIFQKRQKK